MSDAYTKLYMRFETSGGVDHSTFPLWMVEELTKVTAERDEMQQLFDLQHTRTVKADKLFQKSNGVDYLPDLGKLIDWLLVRCEKLESSLALSVGGALEQISTGGE